MKKIKFYVHHGHYENIELGKARGFFGYIGFGLRNLLLFLFNICYGIGLVLLGIITLPGKVVKWLVYLPQHLGSLRHHLSLREFRRSTAIMAMLAIFIVGGVFGAELIAAGQNLKGRVLGESDSGLGHLGEARDALESQDLTRAEKSFTAALESFEKSEQEMHSTGLALQGIMELIPQKHDADQLLEAVRLITEAGQNGTKAYAITQQLKIGPDGISGSDLPGPMLEQLRGLITTSAQNVQKASALLDNVSLLIIPQDKQPVFIAARDALTAMRNSLQTLQDGADLLFDIALGQKNVLLVFQNNNELRPTGGFMGTIGAAELDNGQIKQLDIRSVYDYDGQLQQWILPPQPMNAVNNRWYLRDSNWFADFPTSASKMISMYEKEGGETPDMVIALTPELVIELLRRTGPISLPQHGATLTADNFIEVVQTLTSVTYDKTLNQPKQLLADFFPVLLQQLSTDQAGFVGLMEVLQVALYQKDIILFAQDDTLQQKIESFNWGGVIKNTDRDYLSMISANLGGTKTDRFLKKRLELNSEVSEDGVIINTLTYTVENPLPAQAGLENVSFIRFLVPQGAKLIESNGFSDVPLPRFEDPRYQKDSTVAAWEQTLVRDFTTGTYIGRESNKTLFGNWLKVSGNETKTVTLKYELPFRLNDSDRLSLLWQKQPGSLNTEAVYRVNFPKRKSVWQNFEPNTRSEGQLTFESPLNKDVFLGQVITQ